MADTAISAAVNTRNAGSSATAPRRAAMTAKPCPCPTRRADSARRSARRRHPAASPTGSHDTTGTLSSALGQLGPAIGDSDRVTTPTPCLGAVDHDVEERADGEAKPGVAPTTTTNAVTAPQGWVARLSLWGDGRCHRVRARRGHPPHVQRSTRHSRPERSPSSSRTPGPGRRRSRVHGSVRRAVHRRRHPGCRRVRPPAYGTTPGRGLAIAFATAERGLCSRSRAIPHDCILGRVRVGHRLVLRHSHSSERGPSGPPAAREEHPSSCHGLIARRHRPTR